jgi:transcriptional regulator with XRE-family HTH domain
MNHNQLIVSRLKNFREQRNIAQKHVAATLGITTGSYGRIENGHTELTVNNMYKICECIGISVMEAQGLSETTNITNNGAVLNNVNHGQLHIQLSPEEFQRVWQKVKSEQE